MTSAARARVNSSPKVLRIDSSSSPPWSVSKTGNDLIIEVAIGPDQVLGIYDSASNLWMRHHLPNRWWARAARSVSRISIRHKGTGALEVIASEIETGRP
jgi:hypothetical protein